MPFPNEDTQFRPGQSGNPGGYSKGRRIRNAILDLVSKIDADPDLALAIVACSTGKRRLLKDDQEESGRRTPDLAWWRELRDEIDGPIPKPDPEPASDINEMLDEADRIAADRERQATGPAPGPIEG